MTLTSMVCQCCKHYQDFDSEKQAEVCQAFPDGIPEDIRTLLFDHREPHSGDKGIQWEMNPEDEQYRVLVEQEFQFMEQTQGRDDGRFEAKASN